LVDTLMMVHINYFDILDEKYMGLEFEIKLWPIISEAFRSQ